MRAFVLASCLTLLPMGAIADEEVSASLGGPVGNFPWREVGCHLEQKELTLLHKGVVLEESTFSVRLGEKDAVGPLYDFSDSDHRTGHLVLESISPDCTSKFKVIYDK